MKYTSIEAASNDDWSCRVAALCTFTWLFFSKTNSMECMKLLVEEVNPPVDRTLRILYNESLSKNN